jgi:hypothetical protein
MIGGYKIKNKKSNGLDVPKSSSLGEHFTSRARQKTHVLQKSESMSSQGMGNNPC